MKLGYIIDTDRIVSFEQLFERLDKLVLPTNKGIEDLAILVNADTLEPVEPFYEVGQMFVYEGDPIGIIAKDGQKGYVLNGDFYYYCVAVNNPGLGIFEVPEDQLDTLIRFSRQEPDQLPVTLDEAVAYFLPTFAGFDKIIAEQKLQSADAFASYCHSQLSGGIAMQIRNRLNLWNPDSPMHKYFVEQHKLSHPDAMSALILERIYARLVANVPQTTIPETDTQ